MSRRVASLMWAALAAAAGVLLAVYAFGAAAGMYQAAPAAFTVPVAVPLSGPHSDQCFGKGHARGVAHPGANCWEGQICMETHEAGHSYHEFCLWTASRSGVHVVEQKHVTHALKDYWDAILVGYVTFSMHHGHDWPDLGNPILNQRYEGYPVLNIHRVIDHKLQKDICIGGIPAAAGEPIEEEVTGYDRAAPTCSPVGQGKSNTHNTYIIWHPGTDKKYEPHPVVVNYTRADHGKRYVLTGADATCTLPAQGDGENVCIYHDQAPAEDMYQQWFRAYPSTNK